MVEGANGGRQGPLDHCRDRSPCRAGYWARTSVGCGSVDLCDTDFSFLPDIGEVAMRLKTKGKDRRLLVIGGCVVLFFLPYLIVMPWFLSIPIQAIGLIVAVATITF